ncbi:ArsR/SmtB family transcription factor, partial [Streptomyces angustmyceticus]|uniref:ArsR/SmtB family transcription factor n=1 Tax=Streptomyces angustmyceticus TaxID=285578 RepID=UPI00117E5262
VGCDAHPDLPRPMTVNLLQARLEALAHPVRMRMCRALARGSHTTGELAAAHGLTAPEASRHIARLKKAGLITTQRRGRYVGYQLDLNTVARLGSDFLDSLLR